MRQSTLHTNSGVVLFMVLILTVIMFLVAGTLLIITMTEIRLSDFEYRSTQAFYAAESAIAFGIARLRQNSAYRGGYAPVYYDIGRNPGEIEITTRELPPALYHFLLCGAGKIPGWQVAATRTIEREVTIKPFVIFADQQVTLTGLCSIDGNVHGNNTVEIGPAVTITGNVTASTTPILNQGMITGDHISSGVDLLEPEMSFPDIIMTAYNWTYPCAGAGGTIETCEAKPLIHDTLLLDLDEDPETDPEPVELFSSDVTSTKNPARIFYLTTEIPEGTLTAFNVSGTVIIPPEYPLDTVFVHGSMLIEPIEMSEHPLPALISAKDLQIIFRGDLAEMSESIAENHITGLMYVLGDITLSNQTSGEIVTGSLFGRNITITGNQAAPIQISYNPEILSAPPPGFDLIDLGAWREPFSE